MPITIPKIDDRTYQQLLDEALARIPVHTPEWNNFNESDPGVTLVQLFAFMAESLLYRANLIPERNRRKFLRLLGVPLMPASAARGIVAFANKSGIQETVTLSAGKELRAGPVKFRTEQGLDVLPIESRTFIKRKIKDPEKRVDDYYQLLYSSYKGNSHTVNFTYYKTVLLDGSDPHGVALGSAEDTVDGAIWIALLVRQADQPADSSANAWLNYCNELRKKIAGKTLNLGLIPSIEIRERTLAPTSQSDTSSQVFLEYAIPKPPVNGLLDVDPAKRVANYTSVAARENKHPLLEPSIVELTLPSDSAELGLWTNLDPLEPGVGDFPPALEDTDLGNRLITWLRITPKTSGDARFVWAGINAAMVSQSFRVSDERLEPGTGEPDQIRKLSRRPVLPQSTTLTVIDRGTVETWIETDDLLAAGGEVSRQDPRLPSTIRIAETPDSKVYLLDAEAGELRFGDGLRGKRPPDGAELRVSYDCSDGAAGNVGKGSINAGPSLPAGFFVSNPIPTWMGTDEEDIAHGEKQVARYVQHRDRLVTAADFETIAMRAPGIEIGRIEVLPAYHPSLSLNEPGDAPGVVTLLVIPRFDAKQPDAPLPDSPFLDALCDYLDTRRLVTTELILKAPEYQPVWVSVGIEVMGGFAIANVREAVKQRILDYLAPLRRESGSVGFEAGMERGWPLRKAVNRLQLMAEVSRVPGVLQVNGLLLAAATGGAINEQLDMHRLELPRLAGISVVTGEPADVVALREGGKESAAGIPGQTQGGQPDTGPDIQIVPIPIIPEQCNGR